MSYSVQLIKHADISEKQINEICNLKAIRWDYSLEQHRQWILQNINVNDYHIIITENETPVAYNNLVEISAIVNSVELKFMGLGNVCTSETGRGYGNILMKNTNDILKKNHWKGLLLCKNNLVSYYERFGWSICEPMLITPALSKGVNLMTFNVNTNRRSINLQNQNF